MELNTAFMAETLGKILAGVPATLKITVVTLLIAGPLAFLFAIARTEKKKMADKIIAAYVSFIRGERPWYCRYCFCTVCFPAF